MLAGSLAAGCGTAPSAGEHAKSAARGSAPSASSPRDAAGDAKHRFADAADREAFRAWFVLLADAQFYRPTADVTDCAGLVRHAAREALRPHSPEWLRRMRLPVTRVYPEVANRPVARDGMLPIFHVSDGDETRRAEFADAHTIVRDNAERVGRDIAARRPGDLLVFYQPHQDEPYHLMVFVGRSVFEEEGNDWVVYHTGPRRAADAPADGRPEGLRYGSDAQQRRSERRAGEVRKVRLEDLTRHPAPRWRPLAINPHFLGVYRLRLP